MISHVEWSHHLIFHPDLHGINVTQINKGLFPYDAHSKKLHQYVFILLFCALRMQSIRVEGSHQRTGFASMHAAIYFCKIHAHWLVLEKSCECVSWSDPKARRSSIFLIDWVLSLKNSAKRQGHCAKSISHKTQILLSLTSQWKNHS